MNLYPHSRLPFDPAQFKQPGAEYRGAPFWSWNNRLDRDQLMRQIDTLARMGMGGVHIHARTGLATEYLGDEFMGLVKQFADRLAEKGLRLWLYDEDRWPSGSAGGMVTRDMKFRARHLLFTCTPYDGVVGAPILISGAVGSRTGNGILLARYQVVLKNGALVHYHRLAADEAIPTEGQTWYAYLETALPSPWFNNQTYVDTLNKQAIERFIALTHERYFAVVGDQFGTLIPAIFTDEPQFVHKQSFTYADSTNDVVIPFTDDFFETFQHTYGQSLADHLPELFWELPDSQPSLARYRYHDHAAERFSSAYADTLGAWCRAHEIALTGHMMEEPTLQSQTAALGEAMRSYRAFDLPGIDMLCDWREYTTAKQAQSAAHQLGAAGVLSELYGVTNWDFDFVGHKAQGDWQAALGVTIRVHHLALVSLAGEGKRDYPASISYQSPWHEEYPLIEDYFARLNTVLTRGEPLVRIGVIHPIESYWLCFGPLEQTRLQREERDHAFQNLTQWLLFGLLDFDFIAESLLPLQTSDMSLIKTTFPVGAVAYDVILVPGLRTIRSTTLERLENFHKVGGRIVFAGEVPTLVDAQPSDRVRQLANVCDHVMLTQGQVVTALEPTREIDIRLMDGSPADSILYQLRQEGKQRHVFFCNTDRLDPRLNTQIKIKGTWAVTRLDAFTGKPNVLTVSDQDGWTQFIWDFSAHGSLLLTLDPVVASDRRLLDKPLTARASSDSLVSSVLLRDPVAITLSEPNVLLLDVAQYRLNDEPWQPPEEILRLDNALRQRLGYPLRMEALAQPWTYGQVPAPTDRLSLQFTIETAITITGARLAIEDATNVSLWLDDQPVDVTVVGWFVDEAIGTIRLPPISSGIHQLHVSFPFGMHTNVEPCYLLGDFGVTVSGRHSRIIEPVRELAFGDWTHQGLPFYAGNIIYHTTFEQPVANTDLLVAFAAFRAPLLTVALDDGAPIAVAFAPFQASLSSVAPGPHRLDITAFGSRVNTLGAVHNANPRIKWYGPNAWRTSGRDWAYEYQFKPAGVLIAPSLVFLNTVS